MTKKLYLGTALVFLVFGLVSIFTIGGFFVIVAVAMLSVVWALESRPWIVAGTLGGTLSAVLVFALTAPLGCTVQMTAGALGSSERAFCNRIVLPDIQGLDTTGASLIAFGLAAAGGILAGVLVAKAVRESLADAG